MRDFIFVRDCADVVLWLLDHPDVSGIYNLGTGQARTWLDLAHAMFAALDREPVVEFFDMPDALKGRYQYFTQAEMGRLRAAGYDRPFTVSRRRGRRLHPRIPQGLTVMARSLLLAIDQGTTSSRAMLFDLPMERLSLHGTAGVPAVFPR